MCQALPGTADPAGIDLPWLYVQTIDALEISGDSERAATVAEEAYRRFAAHPDRATAAVIHLRIATLREIEDPAAAFPLIEDAIRLSGQGPPSAGHAEAWFRYGNIFQNSGVGDRESSRAALNRALETAEASGAATLTSRILGVLAGDAVMRGELAEGFAFLDRARALAEASGDGEAILRLAIEESVALGVYAGKQQAGVEAALAGLQAARQMGRQASADASWLANNVATGMVWLGRTAEAAALIDPLTTGPPDRDHWILHECRAYVDMLRGDMEAAGRRLQQVNAIVAGLGGFGWSLGNPEAIASMALWSGRPGDALEGTRKALAVFKPPDLAFLCGPLLAIGMRACADLAENARACQDEPAAAAALAAAGDLSSWAAQLPVSPFADHPAMASTPADRATWHAERTRLAGESDPAAWRTAARAWESLGRPHPAGYAWWRHAEAQLAAGQTRPAATALLTAAAAADGHAPLLERIRMLAKRARIPLQPPPADLAAPRPDDQPVPYGLTSRELAVLRLLATGHTNARIGDELYISPKTASVHITNIMRKLGVTSRVQAAALAERAGLLDDPQH